MIKSKEDLKIYLSSDMLFFWKFTLRERIILHILNDPVCSIVKYLRLLRKEEYFFNCSKNILGKLLGLWYLSRKNKIGNRIGFKIPRNTFEQGLTIYHHGMIIINENVRVGKLAKLHGCNCIGNDGNSNGVPEIGEGLDMGFGSTVLGNISLGNNIVIGAGAIVIDSFDDNKTVAGVPARIIG